MNFTLPSEKKKKKEKCYYCMMDLYIRMENKFGTSLSLNHTHVVVIHGTKRFHKKHVD